MAPNDSPFSYLFGPQRADVKFVVVGVDGKSYCKPNAEAIRQQTTNSGLGTDQHNLLVYIKSWICSKYLAPVESNVNTIHTWINQFILPMNIHMYS